MHVIGPPSKYPVCPTAKYTPPTHLLSSALAFEASLGIPNLVLVQPSIYGTDNSCLLDSLRILGPKRGRGVVVFDPERVTKGEIEEWHRLGVRGVRVNLKSIGGEMDGKLVRKYADVIRGRGWVVQIYVDMETVACLEKVIPELGVKVCFDHFGSPNIPPLSSQPRPNKTPYDDPYALPGFLPLISLLRQGSTYIKISGAYRVSTDLQAYSDLEPLALELIRVAGTNRLVFATDWPFTRFEGVDIRPFVDKVIGWCNGDEELVERLFRGNAEELWDVR
ncbi:MAG: hypothetical protein M1840_003632 [Geoglossum simile]|nr:MAG: hypothetical protein M1840_003632 [Geoglossum simile]